MKKHVAFMVSGKDKLKREKTTLPYSLGFCCYLCRSLWQVKPTAPPAPAGKTATCGSCGGVGFEVDVYYSDGASRYAARGGSKRVGAYESKVEGVKV